MRKIAEVEIN
jgi:hypothetical protein